MKTWRTITLLVVRVRNVVSLNKGRTEARGVREYGAEEGNCDLEKGG